MEGGDSIHEERSHVSLKKRISEHLRKKRKKRKREEWKKEPKKD
jgi:hypothetical protein